MKLRTLLGGGLLLRVISRELKGIRVAMTRQAVALERLADAHGASIELTGPAAQARATDLLDTGVSHLDVDAQMLALDYAERMEREQGMTPSEEEVLIYLADERTQDLRTRLREREQELVSRDTERRASRGR